MGSVMPDIRRDSEKRKRLLSPFTRAGGKRLARENRYGAPKSAAQPFHLLLGKTCQCLLGRGVMAIDSQGLPECRAREWRLAPLPIDLAQM